jgi:hypothetical protein
MASGFDGAFVGHLASAVFLERLVVLLDRLVLGAVRSLLRYSDKALAAASHLGLDMTCLPLQLDTLRAELAEVYRDGDTTELLHYCVRFGDREIVLVISQPNPSWLACGELAGG